MPPDALRTLAFTSELIARLWGADGGTHIAYPGVIEREVMVVGQGPQRPEGTQFLLEQVPNVDDDQSESRVWYVVLSAWEEELVCWEPHLELTTTPVTRLWGPGTWDELRATAAREGATWRPDSARVVDRTFYMRVAADLVEHARSAAQVHALRGSSPDERWYVVRADAPADARVHVHRVLTGECRPHGCRCAATLIFERAHRDAVVRHARAELARE